MNIPNIIDPFHRKLYVVLSADIERRAAELVAGSAAKIIDGTTTVAENYAAQTSYVKALTDVLDRCKQLELEQYGQRPSEGDAEE